MCPKCGKEVVNKVSKAEGGQTILKTDCYHCGYHFEKSLNRFGDEEVILK